MNDQSVCVPMDSTIRCYTVRRALITCGHYLIIVGFIMVGGSACGGIARLHYTIPADYQGFLVVEYQCVGGQQAIQPDARVQITFSSTGVACVTESYEAVYPTGVSSVAQVVTEDGESVPFFGAWSRERQGYGMVGAQVSTIRYGPRAEREEVFEVYWVGDAEVLTELVLSEQYTTEEAIFFEEALGIPINGGERIRPTPES